MFSIILSAGVTDFRNKSQGLSPSRHLSIVNGRPVIRWVIGDLLKNTRDTIYITVNSRDSDLKSFLFNHYAHNPRVFICLIDEEASIIQSVLTALEAINPAKLCEPIRIVLGDTYFVNIPYQTSDLIYVAPYELDSCNWCVAKIAADGTLQNYINKSSNVDNSNYRALAGRYEFSSGKLLHESAQICIQEGDENLSDILIHYSVCKPLYAREIPSTAWIDFGHLEGMALAKSHLMESRNFNSLTIDPLLPEITKRSTETAKLECEMLWYEQLPVNLKSLAPRILDYATGEIKMEYYGYGTLAEKFLYADLHASFWENILERMFCIIDKFRNYPSPVKLNLQKIYLDKTFSRMDKLQKDSNFNKLLTQDVIYINGTKFLGFKQIIQKIVPYIDKLCITNEFCLSHGDFCFGNILYDIHSGIIKLVDPRGNIDGSPSLYGDPRYDIAKLRHSFCGNYDSIIEDDFFIEQIDDLHWEFEIFTTPYKNREEIFNKLCLKHGYKIPEIQFIEALLFLTMIPLHSDSLKKQYSFFLIAIQKFNRHLEEFPCEYA